jgi:hypothetical protein
MTWLPIPVPRRLAGALSLVVATCAPGLSHAATLVPVSGLSALPDGGNQADPLAVTACNGAPQDGWLYRNSEAEPHLAVRPDAPNIMVAGWHQDRWNNGGAQALGAAFSSDGGQSWTQVRIPFTRCSGALPRSAGNYERASDPWLSFGPDGTVHYMALAIDHSVNANAMLVARSADGGRTWSAPTAIWRSPAQDPTLRSVLHDKNSLTADPNDARLVYAGWTIFRSGGTSLNFARSTDGGLTWSPPVPIASYGAVHKSSRVVFRQGTQTVVLPDGTLVNGFYRILFDPSTGAASTDHAVLRSVDQGRHWTRRDDVVAPFANVFAIDPERGIPLRDADGLPSLTVNRSSGELYMTWQDARFTGQSAVAISRSADGGITWSPPRQVNLLAPTAQAFLPMVAVNAAGQVGVMYYDFRNDVLGDSPLSTDVHLAVFDHTLNFLAEHRLTDHSFDFRRALLTGSRGYFIGDYMGLSSSGNDFVGVFTLVTDAAVPILSLPQTPGLVLDAFDRQSIVFMRQSP